MTFVEGFYSFNLEITHPDSGVYEKLRLKTPRHPYESLQYLYARMLAFVHAFRPGQVFSRGLFEPDEPTLWMKDAAGSVLFWGQVGCPPAQKLKKALNSWPDSRFSVYFFEPLQIEQFCLQLRGSRCNWVAPVSFYCIRPDCLEQLIPLSRSSSSWQCTIVDGTLYLVVDDHEVQTEIFGIDIWNQYQLELQKTVNGV